MAIGALRVIVYQALKPWLETSAGLVWLAVLINAGAGVMSVAVCARALAQGVRLAACVRKRARISRVIRPVEGESRGQHRREALSTAKVIIDWQQLVCRAHS